MNILPEEVATKDAYDLVTVQGFALIDIRTQEERAISSIKNSIHEPANFADVDKYIQYLKSRYEGGVIYCAHGVRSKYVVDILRRQGSLNWSSLRDGIDDIEQNVFELNSDNQEISEDNRKRFSRQIVLPEIGIKGQKKLLDSSVLVIGAGGLGCPVLQYLTAVGVGCLGIVDDDVIDISNLQRQVLYTDSDIGKSKVKIASERVIAQNEAIDCIAIQERFTSDTAQSIMRARSWDIVVDCTDSVSSRYVINDECAKAGITLIHGAVHRFYGQLSVFDVANGYPCYRCMFPTKSSDILTPNCADAGVLGVAPGVIGTLQANEVIKAITGVGEVLKGKLFMLNFLNMSVDTITLAKRKDCEGCSLYHS